MTISPAAPGGAGQSTPPWWRSWPVTFLVVFPTVEFFNRVVGPSLPPLPWLVRDVVMVLAMCVVLSNVLPRVNRWLGRRRARELRVDGGHNSMWNGRVM